MRDKLAEERGNVLVTAILLMAIMLSVGIAVASTVDTQTTQSRKERERESTFNLAEAALSAQTFILGRRGTGTSTQPVPVDGLPDVTPDYFCPSTDTLMRSYTGDTSQVDFGSGSGTAGRPTCWTTRTRAAPRCGSGTTATSSIATGRATTRTTTGMSGSARRPMSAGTHARSSRG